MKNKRIIIAFLFIFIVASCTNQNIKKEKITIVTTIYPLYEFASSVAGEKADVYLLLPQGADPHTWEPKPSDIKLIADSDLFIYIGELEPWAEKLPFNKGIRADKIAKLIKPQEHIEDEHEEEHEDEEDEEKHSHLNDPHVWLDFENDILILEQIRNALIQISPDNKDYFDQNFEDYKIKLAELDFSYYKGLSECKKRVFITAGHSAFNYLAQRYNLTQVAVSGISHDAEPSPKRISEIIDIAKKNNIHYIFREKLGNPKPAEILSKELKAEIMIINPGHSKEDKSFIDIMKENLNSFKTALECK